MTISKRFKEISISVICFLYIVLFVYAAVNKVMEFQNFQVQVAQSPLLTAFAGFISTSVIVLEFLIALLLAIPRTRIIGLFSALSLMLLFAIYIYIILTFSPFVPCSCGGILESLGWVEHFYFNLGFVLLAIIGLCLAVDYSTTNSFYLPIRIAAILGVSICTMAGLFFFSEDIVHKRNNFVRSFPPFPAERIASADLKFDSYYFAGQNGGDIYLGNTTAPALITVIDSSLRVTRKYQIRIKDTLQDFRNVRLKVVPPFFYLYDGTVPCIFKGNLSDEKAILQHVKIPGFTKAEVVDSTTFIIRTLSKNHEHLLATISLINGFDRTDNPALLQRQRDGIFDTDGAMHYSAELKKFVYLYYYRNEYIVADEKLQLVHRGHTIDTTSKAKLEIVYVKDRKQRTFAAPPFLVNRLSMLHRNLLFVNSTLMGKYDTTKMWENANFIDVYDILSKAYLFSFYVYKVDGEKIDDLIVTDTHLFILLGCNIVTYRLSENLRKKYIK